MFVTFAESAAVCYLVDVSLPLATTFFMLRFDGSQLRRKVLNDDVRVRSANSQRVADVSRRLDTLSMRYCGASSASLV